MIVNNLGCQSFGMPVLDKASVNSNRDAFTLGQLYVALSRVILLDGLTLLSFSTTLIVQSLVKSILAWLSNISKQIINTANYEL